MNDDDFGQGPLMQFQTINSREIEQKHLNHIKTDVQTRGLQNKVVENAVVIGVHSGYVDRSSLQPMTHGSYDNHVRWLPIVPERKRKGEKCTMVLYNGNHCWHYLRQHCTSAMNLYFRLEDAKEHRDRNNADRESFISELEPRAHAEGSWLAAFYDSSESVDEMSSAHQG